MSIKNKDASTINHKLTQTASAYSCGHISDNKISCAVGPLYKNWH